MYKISYEKCVCFIFLVILAFLSCSGFHIDRMIPLPENNKKYLFTFSFNDSAYATNHFNNHMEDRQLFADQHVGAAPLRDLQRVYERRRKRRIRVARARTSRVTSPTDIVRTDRKPELWNAQAYETPASSQEQTRTRRHNSLMWPDPYLDQFRTPILEQLRDRRAPDRPRNKRRGNKNRFCPGKDVQTRAYQAKTVLEGKFRSKSKLPNSPGYSVTYEVKMVLKDKSGFRPFKRNETFRLTFSRTQSPVKNPCDFKVVEGKVAATFNYSKNYIVFANRIGDHDYDVLGPPVESNRKTLQEIRTILNGKSPVKPARIVGVLKDKTVPTGKKLRLQCKTDGNPPPLVRWYKNNQEIHGNSNVKIEYKKKRTVLVLRSARPEDSGRYTCVAQGVEGASANASCAIRVSEPGTPRPQQDPGPRGSSVCDSEHQLYVCMNGGTCLYFKDMEEYACQCAEGFNGSRCENKEVTNKSSMYRPRTKDCKLGLHSSYYC